MGENLERKSKVNPELAKKVIQDYMRGPDSLGFKPSESFLKKQNEFHQHALALRQMEGRDRQKEGSSLLSLRVGLISMHPHTSKNNRGEPEPLDTGEHLFEEERQIYLETIAECLKTESPEDKKSLTMTMTGMIFAPEVFLLHYKQWKLNYQSQADLQRKFPRFEDYIFNQSQAFIRGQRNDIISARLSKFHQQILPQATSSEQGAVELARIRTKLFQFIDENEEALLSYSGLDKNDPRRDQFYQKFLGEALLSPDQGELARELFEDTIAALGISFVTEKQLAVRNDTMVKYVREHGDGEDKINEEGWGRTLDEATAKDQLLSEVLLTQRQGEGYQPGDSSPQEVTSLKPLETPQTVALEAGGRIISPDLGNNTYAVQFPDSKFQTTMQIIPAKVHGKPENDFNNAKFLFADKYADDAAGAQIELTSGTLRSGFNQMFLDYLMNEKIGKSTRGVEHTDFNINKIVNDEIMTRMAENLFGRKLENVVLTPERRKVFTNFLKVLLKGDEGELGELPARVAKMDMVLQVQGQDYAKQLYDACKADATSLPFTMSKLLERINYQA